MEEWDKLEAAIKRAARDHQQLSDGPKEGFTPALPPLYARNKPRQCPRLSVRYRARFLKIDADARPPAAYVTL